MHVKNQGRLWLPLNPQHELIKLFLYKCLDWDGGAVVKEARTKHSWDLSC